jgi:hypothetical protein
MVKRGLVRQSLSFVFSIFCVVLLICFGLLVASAGILALGYVLFYVSAPVFNGHSLSVLHCVIVMLAVACTASLAVPIVLLARNIQRSTDNFSLLQFDEEPDDEEAESEDTTDAEIDDEELNEFLRKLHKSRNIGPFIPSPKTMDDLCPCGSGLKYKECCGKSWS